MLACWFPMLNSWQIHSRRVRVPGGEVDIVCRCGKALAFVEVKARATERAAGFALVDWRLRRVATAAERLTPDKRNGEELRIDAGFIVPRRSPRHVAKAGKGDSRSVAD